jgi:xylan 1,4-beta-xylosidase
VFDEQGVVKTPFYGGFGLLAVGGIPKPAFNAFALLHQLGNERFTGDVAGALLTRRADGALVLALWNYADPGVTVAVRSVVLKFAHTQARTASVQSLDAAHGNAGNAYREMGAPPYPTQEQLRQLRAAAALPPAARRELDSGSLSLEIPADGLTLVTLAPSPAARH